MKIVCTLGLGLAISGAAMAQEIVDTTLSQIRQSPNAYKDVRVRFTVQFASMGKVQNPFFTQFVPSKYANFYAWADEQQIWRKDDYDALFGLLFLAKRNEQLSEIYHVKVYTRMKITGHVRNVFQSEPWIEVEKFEPLEEKVNTTTLSHMYRGQAEMNQRRWKRAISELSLAPADQLPKHVTGQIHKDLAMCYLRLGESDAAIGHLSRAVEMLGDLDREIRNLARLAKVRPESFLDRVVATASLEDHERPMWEAFEDVREDQAQPAR